MLSNNDKQREKGRFRKTLKKFLSSGSNEEQYDSLVSFHRNGLVQLQSLPVGEDGSQRGTPKRSIMPQTTSRERSNFSTSADIPYADINTAEGQAENFGRGLHTTAALSEPGQSPIPNRSPDNEDAVAVVGAADRLVSESQKLWDEAFTLIEEEKDTKELAESYLALLDQELGCSDDTTLETGNGLQPASAASRQAHMMLLVRSGQEKVKMASRIAEFTGKFVENILLVKPIADIVIQNVPQAAPAAIPWAGICLALKTLCRPATSSQANLEGVRYVTVRMEWYCALTNHILDDESKGESAKIVLSKLRKKITSLYQELLLFLMRSVCSYYSHQGFVFLKALIEPDNCWDTHLKTIKNLELELNADLVQFISITGQKALESISSRDAQKIALLGNINQTFASYFTEQKLARKEDKDHEILRKLSVVDPRDDMDRIEKSKDDLLEESFKWILDVPEFNAFANRADGELLENTSPSTSCRVLCIKGDPGTGKTMLLIGIIRELSARPASLSPGVAHFFFQNKDERLKTCMAAFRSLLWMLFIQQPHLIVHLHEKYANLEPHFEGDTAIMGLRKVFEAVLCDPGLKPVYFIVDALDECDQGLPEFLSLVSDSLLLTDKVKWLVSSRPMVRLKNKTHSLVVLDTQKLKAPVNAYIRHQLSRLVDEAGYTPDVIEAMFAEIKARAQNTYLWVWFVFQKLTKPDKRGNLLNGVHALKTVQQTPSGLFAVYDQIMDTVEENNEDDQVFCKAALRAVFLAYRPLSLHEIAAMARFPLDEAERIIRECHSLLTVANSVVSFMHKSANDYFSRNFSSRLSSVSIAQGHAIMGQNCLRTMSGLHKNMYSLPHIGPYMRETQLPQPDPFETMRYACIHWISHFCDANTHFTVQDISLVLSFLRQHALHWIESLSLLSQLTDSISNIRNFLDSIQSENSAKELRDFLYDILQFLFKNINCIQLSPLQVYASALLFSPENSVVRKEFENELDWIRLKPAVSKDWGSDTRTLDGHVLEVREFAISADRRHLVSASEDGTAKFWDVKSGECLATVFTDSNYTASIFSQEGNLVAVCSEDDADEGGATVPGITINGSINNYQIGKDGTFWTILSTGNRESYPRIISSGKSPSAIYSVPDRGTLHEMIMLPDGKDMVIEVKSSNITIRDSTITCPSDEDNNTVEKTREVSGRVTLSLDGTKLATTIGYRQIEIWDMASGVKTKEFQDRPHNFHGTALSPEAKLLATVWYNETTRGDHIYIWDVASGDLVYSLGPCTAQDLAFSPDSRLLLCRSHNFPISFWNLESRDLVKEIDGFRPLSISPNNDWIIFVSENCTTGKLWHTTTRQFNQTFKANIAVGSQISFSRDGKRFALISTSGNIEIWRTEPMVEHLMTIEEHVDLQIRAGGTISIALEFSPRANNLMVYGHVSTGSEIKCWNLTTGTCSPWLSDYSYMMVPFWISDEVIAILPQREHSSLEGWNVTSGTMQIQEPFLIQYESLAPTLGGFLTGMKLHISDYDLSVPISWITREGKRLLWLPFEYRTSAFDSSGPNMAFLTESGKVWSIGFEP